ADAGGDRLAARRDAGADPSDPQPCVREAAGESGRRSAGDVLERELTDLERQHPPLPCCGPRARRTPAGSRVPIDRIDTGSRMSRTSYLGAAALAAILAVPGLGSAQEAPAGQAA